MSEPPSDSAFDLDPVTSGLIDGLDPSIPIGHLCIQCENLISDIRARKLRGPNDSFTYTVPPLTIQSGKPCPMCQAMEPPFSQEGENETFV